MKSIIKNSLQKISLSLMMVFALGATAATVTSCSTDDNVAVKYDNAPAAVKNFVSKYFAGEKIQSVTLDKDDATPEYTILLVNGVKIEIDNTGYWDEITSLKGAPLPAEVLPANIVDYLNTNYAGVKIVKMEQDRTGYDVTLANRLELEFALDGSFIKIDK